MKHGYMCIYIVVNCIRLLIADMLVLQKTCIDKHGAIFVKILPVLYYEPLRQYHVLFVGCQ